MLCGLDLTNCDYHKGFKIPDMSDEITMFQHAKIITVLCRISYYYLPRPNNVKLKLKILIPLPPGLPSVAGSYHC